jgi:GNAT superfamily N-acetyltransferase
VLALPNLDATVRLRPARRDDIEALARVRIASWRHAYRTILPEAELRRMTPAANVAKFERAVLRPRFDEHLVVATHEHRLVGYAMGGRQPDRRLPFRGEIYELYIDPAHQGRGIGRALLARSIWTLVERSFNPVMLWVLAHNSARHFYASCGGTLVARSPIIVAGKRLPRLAFGWHDTLPVPSW